MRIFFVVIIFTLPLKGEAPQSNSTSQDITETSQGLLTFKLKGSLLNIQLHTPLKTWFEEGSPIILESSNLDLTPRVLNEKLQQKLNFSGFLPEKLPEPEFKISESVGPNHILIESTQLVWSWDQPLKDTTKELSIEWGGRTPIGLWIEWPGLKQNKFLIEPLKPISIQPTKEIDFSNLVIQSTQLHPAKAALILFILILAISISIKKKSLFPYLLPILAITLLNPFKAQSELDSKLVVSWLEVRLQNSLLGSIPGDSSALYNKLSSTFGGKALEMIFLEQKAKDSSSTPSSQKEVSQLSIHGVELLPSSNRDPSEFSLKIDWTLSGVVQHLSHLHLRKTRHLDHIRMKLMENELKIVDFQPIQQRSERGGNP